MGAWGKPEGTWGKLKGAWGKLGEILGKLIKAENFIRTWQRQQFITFFLKFLQYGV